MGLKRTLNKILLTHLELAHELIKNPKEGLCVGGFAIFSKVRGSFAELFHGSLLERLQGLKSRVSVFQEVLHMLKSRGASISSSSLMIWEGYAHDGSKAVLSSGWHFLTS